MTKPSSFGTKYLVIEDILQEICARYHFNANVMKRISNYYTQYNGHAFNAIKTLSYLEGIFMDYNLSKEIFERFINTNPELALAHPTELQRKLVILNSIGLAEKVLFSYPYKLLNNTQLDSLSLYAVIKALRAEGEEIIFDSIYQ